MGSFSAHQPPSEPVVAELMRAGLSWGTAMAMERWKAEEVLDLLRPRAIGDMSLPPPPRSRPSPRDSI